jgi:benzoate-CoA ligase
MSTTAVEPEGPFNFADWLMQRNRSRPTRTAFIDDTDRLTYGALDERVRRAAAGMLAAGLRRDERVLLLMHDNVDWPVMFLGALYAGVVPVAVNTLLTAEDYAYMLQHSRAQAAWVSPALLPTLRQAMAQAQANGGHAVQQVWCSGESADGAEALSVLWQAEPMAAPASTDAHEPAFWLYSSGSTGRPKGTVHSQANLYSTAELYGNGVLALRENDVCFSAAKLFFAYGLGNALSFPLAVGATVVLMAGRPTPEAVFERWVTHQTTVFFGAPTGYAGMLASPHLPAREAVALRLCSSAGEALPRELGERFTAHYGVPIVDGIGSTEMLHIFLSNLPDDVRYGSTGWPVPGYEVALRDDHGQPVPDGEMGDLYIKGPSAALMYWGNREKSRATFQGEWTKSGDKYVRNADGTYTYSGRSDDMIKVSGVYVSPFEVEATLMQHEAVLEAAVIGVEDGEGLTKTKAYVVLKDGRTCDAATLQAFVKDKLAPYKYPRQVAFVPELPKTATGKIQRFKLRDAQA